MHKADTQAEKGQVTNRSRVDKDSVSQLYYCKLEGKEKKTQKNKKVWGSQKENTCERINDCLTEEKHARKDDIVVSSHALDIIMVVIT